MDGAWMASLFSMQSAPATLRCKWTLQESTCRTQWRWISDYDCIVPSTIVIQKPRPITAKGVNYDKHNVAIRQKTRDNLILDGTKHSYRQNVKWWHKKETIFNPHQSVN